MYLGRLLTLADDHWPAVITNLWKAKKSWFQLARMLGWEGVDTRMPGRFYITIVQAIFLFGLETWVVMPSIRRLLGRFPHRVAKRILEDFPRWQVDGTWYCPPLGYSMRVAVIKDIKKYASRRQNTVAQYFSNIPILYL